MGEGSRQAERSVLPPGSAPGDLSTEEDRLQAIAGAPPRQLAAGQPADAPDQGIPEQSEAVVDEVVHVCVGQTRLGPEPGDLPCAHA